MRLGIRQTQVPKRFQTIGLSLDPIRYHFQSRSKGLDGLELHVARMIGPENYQSIYQAFAHSVPLSDREVPRAWNFGTRFRVAQRPGLWGSKGLESSSFIRLQISDPESSKGLESFETHARAAQRPVLWGSKPWSLRARASFLVLTRSKGLESFETHARAAQRPILWGSKPLSLRV